MTVEDHYRLLLDRSSQAFQDLASDQDAMLAFTKAHNFLSDYDTMHRAISSRPEAAVLELAVREYQFALFAACSGMYRHATISLRLFLELALASIQFSAYEIKLRQWLGNSSDINWDNLVNLENGVFSKPFVKAFFPELQDHGREYAALVNKTYRECSEFVHGNVHTHPDANLPLSFDQKMITAWVERADNARLGITFAFASRYLEHISDDAKNSLETIMVENFGFISGIQSAYAKKV